MAETKVPASVALFKQFQERLAKGQLDLGGVVKLGAQYLLPCAVESEVKEMLGRREGMSAAWHAQGERAA